MFVIRSGILTVYIEYFRKEYYFGTCTDYIIGMAYNITSDFYDLFAKTNNYIEWVICMMGNFKLSNIATGQLSPLEKYN